MKQIYFRSEAGKADLYDYYIVKNNSQTKTAEHFNCPVKRVRAYIKKYGFVKSRDKQIEAAKTTNFEKYGQWYWTTEEFKKKAIKTNNVKYGSDWYPQSSEFKTKVEQTCLEKYGHKNVMGNEEIKDKMKATTLQNYGYEWNLQRPEIIAKSHSPEAILKRAGSWHHNTYVYDTESFDSSWELAVWIYAKDHGDNIEHEPLGITYYDELNKPHTYIPDFIWNDTLVEIKGDMYLDEDYNLVDLYNKDKTGKIEAKNKCMKDNNVVILASKEVTKYIEYVEITYGKDYLAKFKI